MYSDAGHIQEENRIERERDCVCVCVCGERGQKTELQHTANTLSCGCSQGTTSSCEDWLAPTLLSLSITLTHTHTHTQPHTHTHTHSTYRWYKSTHIKILRTSNSRKPPIKSACAYWNPVVIPYTKLGTVSVTHQMPAILVDSETQWDTDCHANPARMLACRRAHTHL